MIEPTEEMVEAARRAWADTMALNSLGAPAGRFYNMPGIIAAVRDGITAALAIVERDHYVYRRSTPEEIAARPKPTPRLRQCVENWPDAEEGEYNPSCCRWPKSCSATVYDPERVSAADLEQDGTNTGSNGSAVDRG